MPETRRQKQRAAAHPPRRVTPPTVEQVNELAGWMPTPTMETYVLVAAWSGLRFSEVSALLWEDVKWQGTTARLHVRAGKGDKERYSVLLAPGVRALDLYGRDRGKNLVLPNSCGRRWSKQLWHAHWDPARPPELAHFWFHDLRRFHATYLLDAGMTDLDVAVQLGHFDSLGRPNPIYVRERYGFPSTREALDRIAELEP
jgi:integrase